MLAVARPRVPSGWWVWLAPVFVVLAVPSLTDHRLELVIAGGIALLVLAWGARRPGRALVALAVFLPFQILGFGFLLAAHVPGSVLRDAGGLKELLGASILLAAVNHIRATGRRLDGLDWLVVAYLAAVTAYLLLPHLFAPGSPEAWNVRLLAWRADCGYVLIFFALRHAPIPESSRRWFVRVVLGVATLTVLVGLYQMAFRHSFSHTVLVTGKQIQYQTDVLHNSTADVQSGLAYLTNFNPFRVSSIFISPFDMSDYLLVALGVLLERMARGHRDRSAFLLLGGIGLMLFASRVRADALAAVIVLLVAVIPTPQRPVVARLRVLLAVGIGLALVIPSLGGTRFVGGQGGSASNQGHLRELTAGVTALEKYPLGLGLGTNPNTSARFIGENHTLTSDNSILQVGDELGVLALVPWLALVAGVLWALRRRARAPDALVAGAGLAFLGVLIAGLYHHVFLTYAVPWTLWALVGLALNPHHQPGAVGPDRSPDSLPARVPA